MENRKRKPGRKIPLPRRLAEFMDRPDECWEWTGQVMSNGYGQTCHNYKHGSVHRLAYEILVGPIPDGAHIDHLCRNKRCMNPRHLEPVTPRENTMRGIGPSAL